MPYKNYAKHLESLRVRMAERRSAFFSDKKCVMCGSADDLQLDHIDPKLKVSHRIWSWSDERRAVELAKCQPLCQGCHRSKTTIQSVERAVHGHHMMYWRHGCRCNECLAWKAEDDLRPR